MCVIGKGKGMHERKAREEKGLLAELGRAREGVLASGLWEVGTGSPMPPLRAFELELGQAVSEASQKIVSQRDLACIPTKPGFYAWVPKRSSFSSWRLVLDCVWGQASVSLHAGLGSVPRPGDFSWSGHDGPSSHIPDAFDMLVLDTSRGAWIVASEWEV